MRLKNILRIFPTQLIHVICSEVDSKFTVFWPLLTGLSGFLTGYSLEYLHTDFEDLFILSYNK